VPRTLDAICDRVLDKEAAQHALPIETAHEIVAALSDYVGDPAVAAPVDVPSMYAEPAPAEPTPPEPLPDLIPGAGPVPNPTPEPAVPDPVDPGSVDRAPGHDEPPTPTDRQPDPVVDPDATMAAPEPIWTEEYAEPEEWVPPPPPPPLEDVPHRPLFADHDRRVPPGAPPPPAPQPAAGNHTPASAGPTASGDTGTGTGSRYWPFDDPEDTGGFSGKEGRSWLQLAGIVALAVAVLVAMFIAFDLGRGNGDGDDDPSASPTTPPASPTVTGDPVRIVAAQDFDPEGDTAEENPDQVPFAIDGKPGTGWRTLTYRGNPALGGLKSGVGLVLDLGTEQEVGSVEVRLVGAPTGVELYATAPGVDDPPAELADAQRLTGLTADGTTAVLRVEPEERTRFLIVWLTRLPEVTGGYRGEIAEVTVRS
jgi:hypothetical protein